MTDETSDESSVEADEKESGGATGHSVSIAEQIESKMPDRPSEGGGEHVGARIGDKLAGGIATTVLNLSLLTARLTPGSTKMWRGLLKASYKGLKKSSGADVIGQIMVGDHAKHVPLEYDHERDRYKTLSDDPDWWDTSGQYQDRYHVGSVPTVFASATANDVGDHVQAETAKALELGAEQYLYESATVNHVEMVSPKGGIGDDGAIADGGEVANRVEEFVTVDEPGVLSDKVVDVSWDGDARVISWDNYTDTYPETAAPQKMKEERQLGRLMEEEGDKSKLAMKMLLVSGGIVVLSLAAVFVLPQLLGGGGGGGGSGVGSAIPLTLGALGVI